MKKLIFILLTFVAFSCAKEDMILPGDVCVECTEMNTGQKSPKFCGSKTEAKIFIDNLENDGYSITNWKCKYVKP